MLPPDQGDDTYTPPASFMAMEPRHTKESSSAPPSSSDPTDSSSSSDSSPSPSPSPRHRNPPATLSSTPSTTTTTTTSSSSSSLRKSVVKRKIPYFTSQEVGTHTTRKGVWVMMNGAVYDITEFIPNHPGGEEVIMGYAGKDITEAFRSTSIHSHSDYAFQVLKPLRIGTVEGLAEEPGDIFDHENELSHIIDLEKPIITQMWQKRLPRDVYLKLAHTPHFTKNGTIARLFENDFLELCSRNSWWVVLIWIPVIIYLFSLALPTHGWPMSCAIFMMGLTFWSLLEYFLHRFVFHMDGCMPDHHLAVCAHFFFHGIHHFLPMDPKRLVFPPSLTLILLSGFLFLFHNIFPATVANGFVAGGLFGYAVYDLTHYYLHHATPKLSYMKDLKTYHLNHHYRNYRQGFGVSSKTWDLIFGTVLHD